ncbi:MAG: archaeal heat shock protein Hsp20 [Halobacteriota archaeon]
MAKRRRSFFDDFFGEGFDELMEQMLRDLQEGKQAKPFIYGFSMTQHPGEAPEVREFGNIQPFGRSVKMEDERKPLIDVMETTDEVHVIAEMPGVERTDVQLDTTESRLDIKAQNEFRKYSESVELPVKVDPHSAKATYRNGVLEVRLKRAQPEEEKSHISVE